MSLQHAVRLLVFPPSFIHRKLLAGAILSASFTACVSSDPPPPSEEEDMDEATFDMSVVDQSPSRPDLSVRDMAPVDMAPPMICQPTQRECMGAQQIRVCALDGASWMEVSCGEGDICENGECVKGPICEEGSSSCLDAMTRQFCRPGGMAFGTESCMADTSCIKGACVSGKLGGELCEADGDCAGGKCHCGTSTTEACSDTFSTPAYCTSPCTSSADCADSEWCLDSDTHLLTSQEANYNHCVPRCQGDCNAAEFSCKQLPVRDAQGNLGWEQGCYFKESKELGDPCTADVECLSGYCLKDYIKGGYCSARCETESCPGNAACVELLPGEYWCSLLCGDGANPSAKCPLDEPTDRLEVSCAFKQKREGGSSRVCVKTTD